ncbi:unnamed protein product [Bemisia tabaci]|uniref:Uncharacterized protein n=1 Tax=Bemisia tabaci TaxID=7038 RepID=A0AAI8UU17_BEMTA|nr:unnamed protein product [Bemisia tabaci]
MQMALHDPGKNRRSAEEIEDETARKKFKLEDTKEEIYRNYSHFVNTLNQLLMLTESQEPGVFRILHGQVAVTKVCLDECVDYMSKKFCKSIELPPNEPYWKTESEPKNSALKQLEDELQISTSGSDASPSDSSKCTTCSSSDSSFSSIENNQSGHDDISTSQVIAFK